MKRKVLLQLMVPLLSLCVLFLLLAFDPGTPSGSKELLQISIIPREADSAVWATARQGMEQAAADLGAELRFLTPGKSNQAGEQQELLSREVAGGADAVVLTPADRDALAADVAQASAQTVVVTLDSDMSEAGADACVSVDNAALGETLGSSVLNGVPAGGTVLVLSSVPGSNGIRERLDAAAGVLTRSGRTVRISSPSNTQDLADLLPADLTAIHPDAVIAFEAGALELAAMAIQGMESPPLLYGMGATSTIAAYLEQGGVTAIAAQNEFAAGYLAVESAVHAIRRASGQEADFLAYALVRKETMYTPDNQKLLFPVAR